MTFNDLGLSAPVTTALQEKGYTVPTTIQLQAIPEILKRRDILGSAQTGTGKTAAFSLPMLEILSRTKGSGVRGLILTPTRELALQVADNVKQYGKHLSLRSTVIFGGVSQVPQVNEIRRGVDIIVATPGRLLDLINQGVLSLKTLEMLVLDEADRMLDMGFINDIKKLLSMMPASRQNILFSATMPEDVLRFVKTTLNNPVRIATKPVSGKVQIRQSVYYVQREKKRELLKHVIKENEMRSVIVFARTKHGADKIAKDLNQSGIRSEAFHGGKSQNARQKTMLSFRNSRTRVLVATDVAARGIDIADLPFVINYELPQSADTYTHRIGRTGRAGQTGIALSFCDRDERGHLTNINRVMSNHLSVIEHPFN